MHNQYTHPVYIIFLRRTMEGGSLELIEDMEDLILDTKKRLISAKDVNTSNQIKREDVTLCYKI